MHNRVRMIVASFLVKDLHLDWQCWGRGSSCGTWWTATSPRTTTAGSGWPACGTDAAPFFRVFNPVTQGRQFDPDGDYVRRYVPELRDVAGAAVHEPWKLPGGPPAGVPGPGRRPRRGADGGPGPVRAGAALTA